MKDFLQICSLVVMIGAFIGLLLYLLVKSYGEMRADSRQKKRSAKLSAPDEWMRNRNFGTPGLDIVESLRDVKIEYKGVINIDGQRI